MSMKFANTRIVCKDKSRPCPYRKVINKLRSGANAMHVVPV